jgi:hypothetical protein
MIADTPKDSHPAMLAVKHDICSFVDWGKSRSHLLHGGGKSEKNTFAWAIS